MTKELTTEEVRNTFVALAHNIADYWAGLPDKTDKEKVEGTIFSLFVLIDGGGAMPSFILAPDPHPSDKDFHIEKGDDPYYPENHLLRDSVKANISGCLHEVFADNRRIK
jgi:hypothetical protein